MRGKRAPTIRAKTVIASAPRRTGARQDAWVIRRIAEIRVPEWDRPIQKTKRMIMTPQKTGRLRPVTPSPVDIMYANAPTPTARTRHAAPAAAYQDRVVTRFD